MNIDIAARSEAGPPVERINTARPKLLYSKQEAAETLSVSRRTIDNLITNGELVTRRIGSRVLIPYSCLVQFTRRDHITKGRRLN
jgi:excisionase family DNA binding protein